MPNQTRSGRKFEVLDAKAQKVDRKRFSELHQATVQCIKGVFLAKFRVFEAKNLDMEYLHQIEPLLNFLIGEKPIVVSDENESDSTGHREYLKKILEKTHNSKEDIVQADNALAEQLSYEFAGAAWATIISVLHRKNYSDNIVDPCDLIPKNIFNDETSVLAKVVDDASHFELDSDDVYTALLDTFQKLLQTDNVDGEYLILPRELRVNRSKLAEMIASVKYKFSQENHINNLLAEQVFASTWQYK